MSVSSPKSELSLFETIDIRAFFATLKLRWWIIPVVVAVSVGFLQAQESDLRTEPASYIVSRGYEVWSPTKALSSVGINLALVEFPEPITQLLILKSNEVADEIAAQIGKEVEIKIPENWETPVTFTCNQPIEADCVQALDAYVAKAAELRKSSINTGIDNLRSILVDLQQAKSDPLVEKQIDGLNALQATLDVPFVLVDSFTQSLGPTVSEVRRPTYLMGAAAGLLISFLILLQLTYSDSRIRSVRQLVKLVGVDAYLGRIANKADAVRDRRTAITLHQGMRDGVASRLRYLPLRSQLTSDSEAVLTRLTSLVGTSQNLSQPFAELAVPELRDPVEGEADVIVVKRNRDLRKDVIEALAALQRSDRKLAGVILLG